MSKTPYGLAVDECANLLRDGSCLGVKAEELGHAKGLHPHAHCLLKDRKRCSYFEKCVLPLADAETRQQYFGERAIVDRQGKDVRHCPNCGGPLEARKQYCRDCARKRLRQSNRQSQSRQRRGVRNLPKT